MKWCKSLVPKYHLVNENDNGNLTAALCVVNKPKDLK
uniref:Uncharacterized protein n=1 Tax=Anguilla anguilla TaxID=7936 RepID=A0A0E9WCB9_ANGAN